MAIQTYDPSEVTLLLALLYEVKGYSPDSLLSISKDTNYYSTSKGAFGNVERTTIEDKTYTLELTLSQTSSANSILNTLATLDNVSGRAIFPIFCKDNSGQSLFLSSEAWIESAPIASYTNGNETRTWTIKCASMVWGLAGNSADENLLSQIGQLGALAGQFGANTGIF